MPDLIRHPETFKDWIPAFAGMTAFSKSIILLPAWHYDNGIGALFQA
jgi:hypothetical protein